MLKRSELLPVFLLLILMAFAIVLWPVFARSQDATPSPPDAAEDVEQAADVADDESGDDLDAVDDASTYNNPAQAQKAQNLAEAAAMDDQSVKDALADLEAAQASGDETAIAEAEKALESALADAAGVHANDIANMREDGMGWGQIAHELGVHPGVLGLGNRFGHTNTQRSQMGNAFGRGPKGEMADATARNVRTGWSNGHGPAGDKGKTGGVGNANASQGNASASDKGAKGNNGNNGNGNGNNGNGNNGNGKGGKD
jgi:hypothetical protein